MRNPEGVSYEAKPVICIYCGTDTKVTNSRHQKRSNQVWRRRECKDCAATFTTHEAVELSGAVLIHKGALGPLLPDILFVDLLNALKDHPNKHVAARELTTTVISHLVRQKGMVYPSTSISKEAAGVLRRFDKRAYLRYVAEHPSLQ